MNKEYINELLTVVAAQQQKKHRHMIEVQQLTKELGEGLSNDDKVSAAMILEMRGAELEEVHACDDFIQNLLSGAPEDIGQALMDILGGGSTEGHFGDGNLWERIEETAQLTRRIWKQTVDLDRRLSQRLAGSDSYYQK